jgi:CDP-paratose 2-epimerase
MSVAIVTGSAGLIGSEAARHFAKLGMDVIGLDNDMRGYFFGGDGSTSWNVTAISNELGGAYTHFDTDVRDRGALDKIFTRYGSNISVVIHAAGQPSHDWAAKEPLTDFDVNAVGTLNVLESARNNCPTAPFIFCSTNKVYGDNPNSLPLVELDTRWELPRDHKYFDGVDTRMSIDNCLHSVFGVGKVAADVAVQEYGRYFGMPTVAFRCGTLTGPAHSAAEFHGFLAFLMRCAMERRPYRIFGYKGKQVRDAIHSHDLLTAFEAFYRNPRAGAVYNMGGGRDSHISMIEAIKLAGEIVGEPMNTKLCDNRVGDHMWWITDLSQFKAHYPEWGITRDVPMILNEMFELNADRWVPAAAGRA